MIGWCLAGFVWLSAAIATSLPRWKPYFDKPRPGARSYQPVPGFIPGGSTDSGWITISHIQAYDLRHADWLSESDPYVKFRIGQEEKQTPVVWNNEKNPKWQNAKGEWEKIEFRVDSLSAARFLEIFVLDKDTFTSDPLGGAKAELATRIAALPQPGAFGWLTGATGPQEELRYVEPLTGKGSNPQNSSHPQSRIEFSVKWTPGKFVQPASTQLPISQQPLLRP